MNQSVLKAIELLNCFTKKYELSIIELSEMTGMPKTTVFRLLASLEEGGLLVKNRKSSHDVTYRLSFRMVEFGKVVLDQLEYRDVAYPHMKRLNEELNELVHLVTREGHEAVYVETIDSTKLIRLVVQVGRRSPLYAGSGPKLLLAHMDIDAQEEYLQSVAFNIAILVKKIMIYISKKIDERRLFNLEALKSAFQQYEKKFKALADQRRLEIMYELAQRGQTCVCDLTDEFSVSQSKLSYHLKILLEANLIVKQTKGTWSYYDINEEEVNGLLSEELCCIFRKTGNKSANNSCC